MRLSVPQDRSKRIDKLSAWLKDKSKEKEELAFLLSDIVKFIKNAKMRDEITLVIRNKQFTLKRG